MTSDLIWVNSFCKWFYILFLSDKLTNCVGILHFDRQLHLSLAFSSLESTRANWPIFQTENLDKANFAFRFRRLEYLLLVHERTRTQASSKWARLWYRIWSGISTHPSFEHSLVTIWSQVWSKNRSYHLSFATTPLFLIVSMTDRQTYQLFFWPWATNGSDKVQMMTCHNIWLLGISLHILKNRNKIKKGQSKQWSMTLKWKYSHFHFHLLPFPVFH